MRCQCCENATASVQVRDTANWQVTNMVVVCDSCAQLAVAQFNDPETPLPSSQSALEAARETLESLTQAAQEAGEAAKSSQAKCGTCGMAFQEFQKSGRLGCPDCYTSFAAELAPILERLHGDSTSKYKGRRPDAPPPDSPAMLQQTIKQLTNAMTAAVKAEDYEKAAKLRDEITALKAKVKP